MRLSMWNVWHHTSGKIPVRVEGSGAAGDKMFFW